MFVLVTGGAGFIGSHFVRLLREQGMDCGVVDNLSAGHRESVPDGVPFVAADVGSRRAMGEAMARFRPSAVVHFAGRIQVGESVQHPDWYYAGNFVQTLALLDEVVRAGVGTFVFSSTAAVYGEPESVPIRETHGRNPINAYGASKLAVEMALSDYGRAFGLRYAALRYFNAAGAHPSGQLRERHDPETHLIPLALDAAMGTGPELTVFGEDWPTADGTCIRDYVHVMDLAEAHLCALRVLEGGTGGLTANLGTGEGLSVRQVVELVAEVTGRRVPYKVGSRRQGDPPSLVAAVDRANRELGWRASRGAREMIEDAYRSRRG